MISLFFFICTKRAKSTGLKFLVCVHKLAQIKMILIKPNIDMVKTEDYDDLLQFFQVVNTHTHTKWNYQQHDSKLINSKLCWSPLVQMSFSNTAL